MIHKIYWTAEKIRQRLNLIEPLIYRCQLDLAPFRYATLEGPLETPPVGHDVNDENWPRIEHDTYWGSWMTDFALRTRFQVPSDWEPGRPVALYLPLGEAGDFSHPEAMAYIDGIPYAACDRHHQEILLPDQWRDGQPHLLALHGWTGLGGFRSGTPSSKLFMRPCTVVQVDEPTRNFVATARVALGVAASLEENNPAKGALLNALDEAFKILDTREPFGDDLYESVCQAHECLLAGIRHAGPWDETTISAAYALNDPLIVAPGHKTEAGNAMHLPSLVAADRPNIVIETVKQAEDGLGLIVRLYESRRQRGLVTLTTAFNLAEAWRTNLLEENQELLKQVENQVSLFIKPYEIVTVRLIPVS